MQAQDPSQSDQPKESNLELVASLSGAQVDEINESLLIAAGYDWIQCNDLVAAAVSATSAHFAGVPEVFYSYRVRKLIDAGRLEARGEVTRDNNYSIRLVARQP